MKSKDLWKVPGHFGYSNYKSRNYESTNIYKCQKQVSMNNKRRKNFKKLEKMTCPCLIGGVMEAQRSLMMGSGGVRI